MNKNKGKDEVVDFLDLLIRSGMSEQADDLKELINDGDDE
jgi:hypothetical protein